MRSLVRCGLALAILAVASNAALSVPKAEKCSTDLNEPIPESIMAKCHKAPHSADRCSFWSCLAQAECLTEQGHEYMRSNGCAGAQKKKVERISSVLSTKKTEEKKTTADTEGSCYTFYNDLCPGNDQCRCTMRESCGSSPNRTRAMTVTGGCSGECRQVEYDKCSGPDSCMRDAGVCGATPPPTPEPATPVPINPNAPTIANSPCWAPSGKEWTLRDMQGYLLQVAMDVYFLRDNETYSENVNKRWMGIREQICPPAVPAYSDCSSMVTWVYWTLFGNGTDFLNNWDWVDGWTGSLKQQGVNVPGISPTSGYENLQVGDLCFYYHPMHHVAIYVGGGKIVSHGFDPVGYFDFQYAPIDYCRRYLVAP